MNLDDDTKWLEWVAKQFESIAGEDKEIDLEEFKAALKVKEASFVKWGRKPNWAEDCDNATMFLLRTAPV